MLIDQLSKIGILYYLNYHSYNLNIFKFFSLTIVKNKGLCFGILSNWNLRYLFIGISLFASVLNFVFITKQKRRPPRLQMAFGLMGGGILGNAIDRIRIGAVIDFINLHIGPVFNLADTFIVVGISLLFLEHIRENNEPRIS